MDPFGFWDSLPVVGSYFAGMPRFVKFLLTAILILVIIIGAGKAMSNRGGKGKPKPKEEKKVAEKKPEHRHHRRHHTEEQQPEETDTSLDTGTDLFGDSGTDTSLDLGLTDNSGSGSIEDILSGEPITPESDLLGSLSGGGGETEKKAEKAPEAAKKKAEEKPKRGKELPSEEGPVGLPEDLEEELEEDEEETTKRVTKRKHIGKQPPVEFEEINLANPNQKKAKPKEEKKEEKKGGGFLSGLFGGGKKGEKLTKHDIMQLLDKGTPYNEILKQLEQSGMNHGEARRFFSDIRKKWEANRKPLLDKKAELENQRKVIQYKYLKMQIDEQTFQKMMTDIQKKLVDVETKLKFNERMFT